MKKLFVFLLGIALIASVSSCNSNPDDSTAKTFTSTDYTWQPVFDSVDVYKNGEVVKVWGVSKNEQLFKEKVQIQPTWGQSFSYSFKSGYTGWFILSLVLLGAAGFIAYKLHKDEIKISATLGSWLIFGLLIGVLASFGGQPSAVRWSNYKPVDKEVYDATIKNFGNSQPIWDSLWNNNLIVGANSR